MVDRVMKPITEFCSINMGQSPDSKTYNEKGDGIPFYQGNADFGEIHPKTRVWCSNPVKIANKDDILISVRAPIGAMNIATEKCCIGRGLASITPNEDKCSPQYLFYALKSRTESLVMQGTGSTFKAISRKILENTKIPVYSEKEQLHIVDAMTSIEKAVNIKKEELKNLELLVKARFVELFDDPKENPKGYSKRQLKQTCKVITGNTPPRAVSEYYGEHIEWIKTDNIVSGLINPTTATEFLSEKGMAVGRTVEKDSILMACIAGSLSSIGRVCVTDRKVAFNQQINAIVPNDYNILFLYVLLQISKEYLVEEINMALKGILSKSKLEEKVFIVPPMELQEEFADFVKQIDKSKFIVKKQLEELEILKKSLMQKYFE